MCKAIETEYNGYRFRSRLEARWAVFFDALGIDYEYEPEGYGLESGKKYLPDFKVQCYGTRGEYHNDRLAGHSCQFCLYGHEDTYAYQGECWHPFMPSCDSEEFWSLIEVGEDNNGELVDCKGFTLDENYPFDLYIEVKGRMTDYDADRIKEFAKYFPILVVGNIPREGHEFDSSKLDCYGRMDGCSIYPFNYKLIDGDLFGAFPGIKNGKFVLYGDEGHYMPDQRTGELIKEAYRKARQARFEFGETSVMRDGS